MSLLLSLFTSLSCSLFLLSLPPPSTYFSLFLSTSHLYGFLGAFSLSLSLILNTSLSHIVPPSLSLFRCLPLKSVLPVHTSLSQWGGGLQGHVGVSGLGEEAYDAAGAPAPARAACDHAVRSALLGGQLLWTQCGPDQRTEPHTCHCESTQMGHRAVEQRMAERMI